MKKYMIFTLLPIVACSQIYGARHTLNTMISEQLATAKQSMVSNSRLELDLDKVLQALSEDAKINTTQYNNAFIQLASIKQALETKRNEQYDSAWSKFMWTFGVYPEFVTTDINPAIKRVNETSRSIYLNQLSQLASDVASVGGKIAIGGALIGAGAGLAYLATKDNYKSNNPQEEEVVKKPAHHKHEPETKQSSSNHTHHKQPAPSAPADEDDVHGWGKDNPFA